MVELVCISLATMTQVEIPAKTIVCLGNFDGVHLGHRALFRQANCLQKNRFPDAARCVFSFYEPSWATLSSSPAKFLSTEKERLSGFFENGIEYAILCDFSDIRNYSPKQFAKEVLTDGMHCVAAVCGFNYHFGKMGKGTSDHLKSLLDIPVVVQNEVILDGETVSSTRIRRLLAKGNVKQAAKLLGQPYSISGKIVHGKQLGNKLGFPTINQEIPKNKTAPQNGVYATHVLIDGISYKGVTNIGTHPTVDDDAPLNCETHLLDVQKDLYDKIATISFIDFLRPEQKFVSVEALCAQLQKDIAFARDIFEHRKDFE